ncbi:unnamed protein product, partial [Mesorhabditis spiculigera]
MEFGPLRGLTTEAPSEFHWAFTDTFAIKYRPDDEARYVWRLLLDRGDYTRAVTVARDRRRIDPSAYELVLRRQADKHILDKNYIAAAEILAYSSEPFETLVLRFLSTDDDRRTGLKTLLEKRLEQYSRPEERIKRDALILWLLEVQLEELAESRRGSADAEGERAHQLTKQLISFLNRKVVFEFIAANKEAVYKLVVSHADFEMQLYIAQCLKDWPTVANIHILRERFDDALAVLKEQKSADLYVKYAPILAIRLPKEFFESLVHVPSFRPKSIVSVLAECQNEAKLAVAAMTYLDWAISKVAQADIALRNLLIAMYARYRPKQLLVHLEGMGRDRTRLNYDTDFALRTCQQYRIEECIVFLYCVNEMFPEAVDIALKLDLDLAKKCARWMDAADDDIFSDKIYPEELRRKVWLMIAEHVIKTTNDATVAIGLLRESGDVIKIQDILPFFADFTELQLFKEPLTECLREHSAKIQDLQTAMREATTTAKEIRDRSEKLGKRYTVIRAAETCCSCSRTLMSRPFFSYACRHFFHRDCIEGLVRPLLNQEACGRLDRLVKIEGQLIVALDAEDRVGNPRSTEAIKREQRLSEVSADIGEILGDDCPLCGIRAIEQIDRSFFDVDAYEADEATWKF